MEELFLRRLPDARVNVRLFGLGLNIVIVLANAPVTSIYLYLATKGHLGNHSVTNPSI